MPLRLFLTILICVACVKCFSQNAVITGIVLDETTNKPIAGARIDLQSKDLCNDTLKIIATKISDSTGYFRFENVNPKKYSLFCFYKMTALSDWWPKSITDSFGRTAIDSQINIIVGSKIRDTFRLLVTCPYDKTKNLDYCPVCKKSDMVQPILWGLPNFDLDGNLIGK